MNEQNAKRRPGKSTRATVVVVLLLAIYLAVQIGNSVMNGVSTTPALRITADDSFSAKGWFFREEVLANGVSSETVKHIVRSGEKIQKDAALAIVYTDAAALETSQRIGLIDDEIELLNSAMQSAANKGDSAKLDGQIAAQIAVLSADAQDGIVTGIEEDTSALRNLCLRRSAGELDSTALSAQLSALTTERDSLSRQLTGRSTTIASPSSGFFSEIVDGFESRLSLDALAGFTMKDFKALDENDIANEKNGQLGKIIGNFRWYFMAAVPVEELVGIETGTALRLRFAQVDEDIPVTVYEIRQERDADEALLILTGMDITPEIVTMRCQTAEIIRNSYTGIKVPKSAVKIRTDEEGNTEQGVYILPDSVSRFKKIDILFEGSDYFVVRQGNDKKETGLVAGDKIIVKARGLDDMKVIK